MEFFLISCLLKVTITGFDLTNYRQCLTKWNAAISIMDEQCKAVGDRCLRVGVLGFLLGLFIYSFNYVSWTHAICENDKKVDRATKEENQAAIQDLITFFKPKTSPSFSSI